MTATGFGQIGIAAFIVLLPWLGFALLFRESVLIFTRKGQLAPGLISGFIGILALLVAPPVGSTGGCSMPIAWLLMPFTAWAALSCGLLAVRSLAKQILENSLTSGHWKPVGLLSLAALIFAAITWLNKDPIKLFRGSIPIGFQTFIGLLALAIITLVAMTASSRGALSLKWPKLIAIHLSLVLGCVIFGLPFLWLLITSFKEEREMNGAAGIVWLPHVQEYVPYKDPKNPLYSTNYDGTLVEVVVVSREGDSAKVEINKPGGLHGITFQTPATSLTEIPKQIPLVQGTYDGRETVGKVVEEMSDGHRRIEITQPPEMKGLSYVAEPAQVRPVQKVGLRWENYPDALDALPPETHRGLVYLKNTLIIVLLNVIGTLLSSSLAAYAFARMRFPGRSGLFTVILSTMMLPAAVTLLPAFLIYRYLGWVDTLFPLWVPAFFGSAFNIFLLRQFFLTIPMEFEDAAKIDGCSYLRTFWSVMLPQIKPALAAIAIWTFMGTWGDFMGPLIYISSPENMTISYAMQLFSGDKVAEPGLLMAFATMAMLPVLTLFFLAQRYFVQGMALTGLSAS